MLAEEFYYLDSGNMGCECGAKIYYYRLNNGRYCCRKCSKEGKKTILKISATELTKRLGENKAYWLSKTITDCLKSGVEIRLITLELESIIDIAPTSNTLFITVESFNTKTFETSKEGLMLADEPFLITLNALCPEIASEILDLAKETDLNIHNSYLQQASFEVCKRISFSPRIAGVLFLKK